MAEYFNTYAYAHCAIYGTSFMQSAKMAFSLFASEGFTALINDDLTGMVLFAGSLVGGVVTAACGAGVGYSFYYTDDSVSQEDSMILIGAMAGYGFLIGFTMTLTTLYVVRSAVVTLLYALQRNQLRYMRTDRKSSRDYRMRNRISGNIMRSGQMDRDMRELEYKEIVTKCHDG